MPISPPSAAQSLTVIAGLLSQELPEAEPQGGDTDEGGTPCSKRGVRRCSHRPESGRAQHCDDERPEHDDRCPEAPKR